MYCEIRRVRYDLPRAGSPTMTITSLSDLVAYDVGGSHSCGVGLSTTGGIASSFDIERLAGVSVPSGALEDIALGAARPTTHAAAAV